ncbi:BspA family leucine-rich repeat surface protein [Chryseobacterium caseinilyticum]|uniref:BspA family leucine-rich repeat surface protein n=1 Tax=Chryseobacterium caseinilyticum TaxID=2771428 RepID=A0ABR8ZGH8_9FLAO|nr:BspA family leucine-rich repeat surface protein [Chryseobacterium caseinilyticum]MBD8084413.1 BspA family leucine-rich repeat surface protein [Chryseobacterium caseinilyticum]
MIAENYSLKRKLTTLLLLIFSIQLMTAQNEFITTCKPGNIQTQQPSNTPFPSSNTQAWIPIRGTDFTVYWEEVGFPAHNATVTNQNSTQHILLDFGTPYNPVHANATYRVKISNGNVHRILFHEAIAGTTINDLMGDNSKITEINQWGSPIWSSMANSFAGCTNLDLKATDSPNLSMVTDMQYMFAGCISLVGNPSINNWDTSQNTTLDATFHGCALFNQPLNNWNTSNVTSMGVTFMMAQNFNQPLGNWDTSEVTDMTSMFFMAKAFNQPIGNWDVSKVADMEFMFSNAWQFNQDISGWNTGEVILMNHTFQNAKAFNQPIGSWNTSKVTTMHGMFAGATAFNQPIGNWTTSSVINMNSMFQSASSFNQNLAGWNTSQVNYMQNMFTGAINFNQSLGTWNLSSLLLASGILQNSGLNCQNYDSTLYGWSLNPATPNNINISSVSPMIYTHPAAVIARNYLINNKGWTITGDSYDDKCISALSTQDNVLESDFSIYPNPASDFIYFKNIKDGVSYIIFDNSGRIVLQNNLDKNQIDVRILMKGNYIIQLKTKSSVKNFKLIKN